MNDLSANYVGFWRRVVAYIIDSIVLMIPLFILMSVFGVSMFTAIDMNIQTEAEMEAAMAQSMGSMIGINLLSILISFLYFVMMESSSKQGTVGKMIIGAKVTDSEGDRITFGKAAVRFLGKIASSIIFGIGFLMVAFTKKKQGLHDMMADTVVVNK